MTGEVWLRYAVECEVPADDDGPQALAKRCRTATAALSDEGRAVRFLRCVYLPERSVAILLFEAPEATDVEAATERALGTPAVAVALGASGIVGELIERGGL